MPLCASCDQRMHAAPKFRAHDRVPMVVAGDQCANCEVERATIPCASCAKSHCQACDKRVHQIGKFATHVREQTLAHPSPPPTSFPPVQVVQAPPSISDMMLATRLNNLLDHMAALNISSTPPNANTALIELRDELRAQTAAIRKEIDDLRERDRERHAHENIMEMSTSGEPPHDSSALAATVQSAAEMTKDTLQKITMAVQECTVTIADLVARQQNQPVDTKPRVVHHHHHRQLRRRKVAVQEPEPSLPTTMLSRLEAQVRQTRRALMTIRERVVGATRRLRHRRPRRTPLSKQIVIGDGFDLIDVVVGKQTELHLQRMDRRSTTLPQKAYRYLPSPAVPAPRS